MGQSSVEGPFVFSIWFIFLGLCSCDSIDGACAMRSPWKSVSVPGSFPPFRDRISFSRILGARVGNNLNTFSLIFWSVKSASWSCGVYKVCCDCLQGTEEVGA